MRPMVVRARLVACLAAVGLQVGLMAHPVAGARRDVASAARVRAGAPALDDTIVFSSLRTGNGDLYSVHSDGTGLTRLTTSAGVDAFPSVSPDGTRVAFVSTRDGNAEIYVMAVDGTGLVRLTNNKAVDSEPDWSPDGSRIAFTSTRTGSGDIYSMRATDGSDVRRITTDSALDASPAFSPDGTQIAFASLRSGLGDIYRVKPDGTGLARLTTSVATDAVPAWSPDGSRIAFASLRTGNSDIYSMRPDGSQQTRLTTSAAVETEPAWSPDGTRLAITSSAGGGLNLDVRLINADGSGAVTVAANPAVDGSPDWAGSALPSLASIAVTSAPDPDRRSSALISSRYGGSVETDGADGTHYRLFIPAGALAADTTISIAPTIVTGLGAIASSTAYSVEFGPSGTTFSTPATLTITPPAGAPPAGDFVIRWSGPTGVEIGLPTVLADGSIVMSVPHFSGETTIRAVAHSYNQMLTLALATSQIGSTSQFHTDVAAGNGTAAVADLVAIFNANVAPALAAAHRVPTGGPVQGDLISLGVAARMLQDFSAFEQVLDGQIPGAAQLPVPGSAPPQSFDDLLATAGSAFLADAARFEAHYVDPVCDGTVSELADWIVVPATVDGEIQNLGGNPAASSLCVGAHVDTVAFPGTLPSTQQLVDATLQGGVIAPAQTPGGIPTPGGGAKLFPQQTVYHLTATGGTFGGGASTLDSTSSGDGTVAFEVDRGSDASQRDPQVAVDGTGEVKGFWADVALAMTVDSVIPVHLSAGPASSLAVAFRSPPTNDVLQPGTTSQLCVDVADATHQPLAQLPVNWSLSGDGSLTDTTTLSDASGVACVDYQHPAQFVIQGDTATVTANASHNGDSGSDHTTLTPAWVSISLEAKAASDASFVPATNTTIDVPTGDQVQERITATTSGLTVNDPPVPCVVCLVDLSVASGGGVFMNTPNAPTATDEIGLDDSGQALVLWDPAGFSGEAQLQFLLDGVAATTTLRNPLGVTIIPAVIVVAPGQHVTFTATVHGGTGQGVTWTTNGGSIDQSGVFIAGAAGGPFRVTATSVQDPTVSAYAVVGISTGTGPNDLSTPGSGGSYPGYFTDVALSPSGVPYNTRFAGTAGIGNNAGVITLAGTGPLSFFNFSWNVQPTGGTSFTATANGCCNPEMQIIGSVGGGVMHLLIWSPASGENLWTFDGTLTPP